MSRCPATSTSWKTRFPRVSGDEPDTIMAKNKIEMFSPRERG